MFFPPRGAKKKGIRSWTSRYEVIKGIIDLAKERPDLNYVDANVDCRLKEKLLLKMVLLIFSVTLITKVNN